MDHNILLFWEGNNKLCAINLKSKNLQQGYIKQINKKHKHFETNKIDSPIFMLYSLTFRTKAVFFLKSYILLKKVGILMQLFKTLMYPLIFL